MSDRPESGARDEAHAGQERAPEPRVDGPPQELAKRRAPAGRVGPDEPDPDAPDDGGRALLKPAITILVLVALGALLFLNTPAGTAPPLPYNTFKELVREGAVESVRFEGHAIEVALTEERALTLDEREVRSERFSSYLPPVDDPELLGELSGAGVEVLAAPEATSLAPLLWLFLPWLLILGLFLWARSRSAAAGAGGMMGMDRTFQKYLKGNPRTYEQGKTPRVTFQDVAGAEQAKREVQEIVDFLREPERFASIGAQMPRGILLEGPPGTGKTLLARAVAGEAGVAFFSISASEFIEMFVGVGAARVRSLFEKAKQQAPSIIFIDEIDSIGRTRGTGLGGGHDEREQTLNQILSEMDGFEHTDYLVVLAATNRSDVLDPALMRPGRFDRRVTLDLPDLRARRAILEVHVRQVQLDAAVDLELVARATIGFSGADLKNLVNEAAISALRHDRGQITGADFDEAREKITFGPERSLAIRDDERRRLAIHESGHTLVGWYQHQLGGDPVEKVTIVPRGHALGATLQLPESERVTFTESYLRGKLAVMLAGRAAEEELTGEVSTGAEDDIKKATELARRMVSQWGMDRELGPINLSQSEQHPFLGKEMSQPRRFSETTAHQLDLAVTRLLEEAEDVALSLIREQRPRFERLIARLEADETLDRADLFQILGGPDEAADALHAASQAARRGGARRSSGRREPGPFEATR